ncbi:winged helix DNA-binding domain-containing protein [Actinoallomurus purpureus]|uniref:winged helix DNA-binding domain-containing protein n=1 Tax=Actinoallomurus purpureus TaxID=478114 RepID=UPI002092258A|nr:winged helix DNA-binding domain-containing protein [Actinoallomurus purpureus]MCO6003798.1 winged helix DNA-binding domain-containing protein [Actinoallomurus purpureus]
MEMLRSSEPAPSPTAAAGSSPRSSISGEVIGRRALNRALLARQTLLAREALPAVRAVDRLVGMQAQAPLAPYVGLWTRLEGFQADDLADRINGRDLVRIALMRGTIHLVSAADCLELRPLLQPMLDRALKSGYGRHLTGLDVGEVETVGRALMEEQPRTFAELGESLGERWPDRDRGALTAVVRTRVPLVQLPPRGIWGRGGRAVHTSAEAWLGQPRSPEPSPEDMVLRHLAAYGPASVKDLQVWSGLTRQREVIERLRPRLLSFRDEKGIELFDLPDAPRPDPDVPAPPRFLPEYDNLLRSHADRTRVLPDEHRGRLATPNDSPRPTFLIDGFVHGTWRISRGRDRAVLTVEPYAPLAARDRTALAEEGARLLAFAAGGAAHDIRIID